LLRLQVARISIGKIRPGGTLLFIGGTGGRRAAPGLSLISALTAAGPALTRNLAIELAPIRVNLIAAGFVDTPLSASILGKDLDKRRAELGRTLPIRRVVGPTDIAALAVHLMTNSAVTGATFDIDGGQQLIEGTDMLPAAAKSKRIRLQENTMPHDEFPPSAPTESTEPDALHSQYVQRHIQWIPALAFAMLAGFALIFVFVL